MPAEGAQPARAVQARRLPGRVLVAPGPQEENRSFGAHDASVTTARDREMVVATRHLDVAQPHRTFEHDTQLVDRVVVRRQRRAGVEPEQERLNRAVVMR